MADTSVTSTYGSAQMVRVRAAAEKQGRTVSAFQQWATMQASPPVDSWYDHMGVSITAPRVEDISRVLQYGRYVRAGWEECWPLPTVFMTEAKRQGAKVIACLQPCPPNRYMGWDLARVAKFSQWCVQVADLGVDVIEVGNELNNPTFNAARDIAETTAALITHVVATDVHRVHPTVRVISNGWSPRNENGYYPQVAMQNMMRTAQALGIGLDVQLDGYGYHPYEMKELPSWVPPATQPGWNACYWMQDAWQRLNNVLHAGVGPICVTEYGKIGGSDLQAAWARDYWAVFERYRANGMKLDLVCWHTLRDGQSTLPGEGPMGLIDANNVEKPSGVVVREQGQRVYA